MSNRRSAIKTNRLQAVKMFKYVVTFACFIFTYGIVICLDANTNKKGSMEIIRNRTNQIAYSFFEGIHVTSNKDESISLPANIGRTSNNSMLRVCYYTVSGGSLSPKSIDPFLCTHIIVGFATVSNATLIPTRPTDVNTYQQTIAIKQRNPQLVVMLSLGGGGSGFNEISIAVQSETNRNKFIKSIIYLLRKYGFDGIDVDWEFPGWDGAPAEDKHNFVRFLKEFNYAAQKEAEATKKNRLILSVAVAAVKPIIKKGYEIKQMARYLDFVNLMSYDYHDYQWYMPFTAHNSPLFKRHVEHAYFATLNTAWSAAYWVKHGLPKEKLMIGLPTYGHTYKLLNASMHGLDAPATGHGAGGGDIAYPDICKFLKQGATRVFDKESEVPYAYKDLDWIGYDDSDSIGTKAKWVKQQNFGGIMTFDLNCDDWNATCDGRTTFPLHRLISSILLDKQ